MATLVMIPDGWDGQRQRPLRGRQHKRQFQRLGQFPRHHITGIPIDHGHQIEPSMAKPYIRNIDSPHVIGEASREALQ